MWVRVPPSQYRNGSGSSGGATEISHGLVAQGESVCFASRGSWVSNPTRSTRFEGAVISGLGLCGSREARPPFSGVMAEWFNAAVCKTAELRLVVGSNPTHASQSKVSEVLVVAGPAVWAGRQWNPYPLSLRER